MEAATIEPRRRRSASVASVAGSTWLVGALIAILSMPELNLTPMVPGLDPSARVGIDLAARLGLDQGTQFTWTYGPLGFLELPSAVAGSLAPLALVHFLCIRLALAISLLWAARRSFPLWAAAPLAYVASAITATEVAPLALALIWSLVALSEDPPPWSRALLVYGGGLLAAVEGLVKLNLGGAIMPLVLIGVAALPGARAANLLRLVATFVVASAALWFASGQGVSNIDDFVAGAIQIVGGYSTAMTIEFSQVDWDGAAAAAMTIAVLACAWWATRRLPLVRRAAIAAVLLLALFVAAKQSFVRHDTGHASIFVGVAVVPWLAFRWSDLPRLAPALCVLAIGAVAAPIRDVGASVYFRPLDSVEDTFSQTYDLVLPSRRNEIIDEVQESLRGDYGLDPAMLARLERGTVHVDPWETAIVWAYELDWDPVPTFQEYSAYTKELDQANADELTGDDPPQMILRAATLDAEPTGTIDFRYGAYDDPATVRAMLCDYRVAMSDDRYQLLVDAPNRCSEPRELRSVTARFDEAISVPDVRPNEMLFARVIGDEASGLGRLRTLVYKDVQRAITLDDQPHRFVASPAENGILISAPPKLDFPAPFALAPSPSVISFSKEAGIATGPPTFTVEFFAVAAARR